jgi:hypothetical protein
MESIPENLEALLRSLASDALKEDKNSKWVRHSSGQIIRLLLDAKRTEQGYRGADVFVGPSRTEEAYVAAVLALHGEEMEREGDKKNPQSDEMAQASKAILFFELMRSGRTDGAARDTVYQGMRDLHLYKEGPSRATDFVEGLRLTPVYELLRYFRPELDDMSEKERIELLERTIGYINDYLKVLRRLTAFLQFGKTGAYEGDRGRECDCTQRSVRATKAERVVWTFVSNLLREPETIQVGMERLIEEERSSRAQNPEHEAERWAQRIADCAQRRSAYQDQQAAGMMSLEELGSKLRELNNTRRIAERELATLKDHRRRVEDLEQDRDALLESIAEMVPEALDSLTGEEKSRVYRMLRLEVTPTAEGYAVSGALCTSVTPSG